MQVLPVIAALPLSPTLVIVQGPLRNPWDETGVIGMVHAICSFVRRTTSKRLWHSAGTCLL
jgi:hypothetical protein